MACTTLSFGKSESSIHLPEHFVQATAWGQEDGLPHWSIVDITESKEGFLWILLQDKLVRFDGNEFRTFTINGPEHTFKSMRSLAIDRYGRVWVFGLRNTRHYGLKVFDPHLEIWLEEEAYLEGPLPDLSSSEDYHYLWRLMEVDGILYLSSLFGEVWIYDGKSWRQNLDLKMSVEGPVDIYPAGKNRYWMIPWMEQDSLLLIDNQGLTLRRYQGLSFSPPLLGMDANFALWYHEPKRDADLYYQVVPGQEVRHYPAAQLPLVSWRDFHIGQQFLPPNAAGYRLVVNRGALHLYDRDALLSEDLGKFIQESFNIKENHQYLIFIQSDGSFWVRGVGGLIRIRITKKHFRSCLDKDSLGTSTRGIGPLDESRLLINSYKGSFVCDKKTLECLPFPLDFQPEKRSGFAVFHQQQNLWIGSSFRILLKYSPQENTFLNFTPDTGPPFKETYDFFHLADSSLLMGAANGLFALDESTQTYHLTGFRDTSVYFMEKAGQDIWLGTDYGLFNWKKRSFYLQQDMQGNPFSIYHLHHDADGSLWLATNAGLVHWVPGSEQYKVYNKESGFPNDRIHCVYEDGQGRLWMSSNHGLIAFHKKSKHIHTYFITDGLPTNEFNFLAHYQAPDGQLFLGTIDGMVSFRPEDIPSSPYQDFSSQVYLNEVIQYDYRKSKPLDRTLEVKSSPIWKIPRKASFLNLSFSIPYYGCEPLQVFWRIPEHFQEWQLLPEQKIGMVPPQHGRFDLEIKAHPLGQPGQAVVQTLTSFEVAAPLFAQKRFWGLLILAAVLLGLLSSKLYNRWLVFQNRELQAKVRASTSQIQDQLIQIQNQHNRLQELDSQKSRFFANLSHELRTPITLLKGLATERQSEEKDERADSDRNRQLAHQIEKLEQIAEEINDLIHLDTGKLPTKREIVKWPGLFSQIMEDFKNQAAYKHQQLQWHRSTASVGLISDPVKLERILTNLVGNALKFTPRDGKVSVYETIKKGTLEVIVEDSGPGIDPAELDLIFSRFFQSRTLDRYHHSGLGIGLSIVREYAHILGGSVRAENRRKGGARFILSLPIETAPFSAPEKLSPPSPTSHAQRLEPSPVKPCPADAPTLLLVDDDPEMLEYISGILGPYYQILNAVDGEEALHVLHREDFDTQLIVSDLRMPHVNGLELLQKVREQEKYRDIPFLLLTALTEPDLKLKAFRLGVDDFLNKPFAPKELLARVRNQFRRRADRQNFRDQYSSRESDFNPAGKTEIPYDQAWMESFYAVLTEHLKNPNLKVGDLAQELHISERTLRNRIQAYTGLTPSRLLMKERLNLALSLLKSHKYATVSEVCYEAGIKNASHFSRAFKEEFGKSPSEYL